MRKLTTVTGRYRIHAAVVLANVLFAATFMTVALTGFHRPVPHGLPVGVVAPVAVTQRLERGIEAKLPGGFDLRPVSTAAQARAELSRRDIDAAVVLTPRGVHLLTAEAVGSSPTAAITNLFTAFSAESAEKLTVTDVVPPTSEDTSALSSFFLILCALFPSLAAGIAAGHVLRRTPLLARLAVLVAVAGSVGLVAAAIGDGISDLGHYWALAGIVALFSLAISASAAALGQIRPHLVSLCVLAFLVLGIPVSGGPSNLAAFGPSFLRSLFSALPLGVAADTVRNTVYFHAAHTAGHLMVLTAYAGGGVALLCLLVAVGCRRRGGPASRRGGRGGTLGVGRERLLGGPLRVGGGAEQSYRQNREAVSDAEDPAGVGGCREARVGGCDRVGERDAGHRDADRLADLPGR